MSEAVRQLTYRPSSPAAGPIELMGFADLRRTAHELRQRPQRPDFHVVALVRSGHGRHRVDFVDTTLHPGTVVWVRPGQVNQWLDVESIEGDLVLFTATAVEYTPGSPTCWAPRGTDWALVLLAADHLRAEYDASPTGPILHDLLAALLRRAVGTAATSPPSPDSPVERLRVLVEDHLARGVRWGVRDYAVALGYSARTLDRAVTAASGVNAKTWLDQRTALEAKRLLAHTTLSAASCGRRLGFDDASNFSAFFARAVGSTPQRWRRSAASP